MKYKVTVRRVEYRENVFTVDAESAGEAEDMALEASSDHDFNQNSVSHADEEVMNVKLG